MSNATKLLLTLVLSIPTSYVAATEKDVQETAPRRCLETNPDKKQPNLPSRPKPTQAKKIRTIQDIQLADKIEELDEVHQKIESMIEKTKAQTKQIEEERKAAALRAAKELAELEESGKKRKAEQQAWDLKHQAFEREQEAFEREQEARERKQEAFEREQEAREREQKEGEVKYQQALKQESAKNAAAFEAQLKKGLRVRASLDQELIKGSKAHTAKLKQCHKDFKELSDRWQQRVQEPVAPVRCRHPFLYPALLCIGLLAGVVATYQLMRRKQPSQKKVKTKREAAPYAHASPSRAWL